ncbi:MAG: MBL fold metallo-hydrolase [Muribaculaceae bacterium]|nr:MBL fold metallo-hydrolase [Muribaculaceae bacterium]
MAKLTYIFHDCFVLETAEFVFVFDFWKDPFSKSGEVPYFLEIADKNKTLVVVVSHHHKDHYSKYIFGWAGLFKDTRYILSKDTAKYCRHILRGDSLYKGMRPDPQSVTVIGPGERFVEQGYEIFAFSSTDIGNSYVVKTGGKIFFHAGDLNDWSWRAESTEDEVREEKDKFLTILNEIKSEFPRIDYAMFPVDPRMGEGYWEGAATFNRLFDVGLFIPMHFCLAENPEQEIDYIKKVWETGKYANPERGKVLVLTGPYSELSSISN